MTSDQPPRDLALLTNARRALAEAKSIPEFKAIRDQGHAALRWAKSRREIGQEALNEAAEIVLRAERQLGELLQQMDKNPGVLLRGDKMAPLDDTPTYAELGINKKQASRWQAEAAVLESDFEDWLDETRRRGRQLTSTALIKLGRQKSDPTPSATQPPSPRSYVTEGLDELVEAGKTFGCIYAGPPWPETLPSRFDAAGTDVRTVSLDVILAAPVAQLAANDCHLHLWATNEFLPEAFDVIEDWGFEYRSVFVWIKRQMGPGEYWRSAHEFLLLGIKGDASGFVTRGQKSWAQLDATDDGRKPDGIRPLLEKVSPGPFLELYGQGPVPGWTVWTNDTETS